MPKTANPAETVYAAGGVVFRRTAWNTVEIAIIHRPRYDDWSLPKGKVDPGESLPMTAIREIREETGLTVRLSTYLAVVSYPVASGERKSVSYWAAELTGGEFSPNDEVDQLRWLDVEAALTLVSYALDRKIIRAFVATPIADRVCLLIRHAKAGDRNQWRGDDDLRPLEPTGRSQAEYLAPLSLAFGIESVFSVPKTRCVETVTPLAQEIGVEIAAVPDLGEEAYAAAPSAGYSAFLDTVRQGPRVAVCSQGGVIPAIVERLITEAKIDAKPRAKKGSVWVLSFAEDRLIGADYLKDPLPLI